LYIWRLSILYFGLPAAANAIKKRKINFLYKISTTCNVLCKLFVSTAVNYKLSAMTYKIHSIGLSAYLSHHINPRESAQTLRSSDSLLLTVPFTRTEFAMRAFRCLAPSVWNSLPSFITNSGSLTTFKSRLKNLFFQFSF